MTTKIQASREALGNPTGLHRTPGQAHDLEGADALLPDLLESLEAFLADVAQDARERVLDLLEKAGVRPSFRQGKTEKNSGLTMRRCTKLDI